MEGKRRVDSCVDIGVDACIYTLGGVKHNLNHLNLTPIYFGLDMKASGLKSTSHVCL